MPEWICLECHHHAYGWGPKYGQPCPHCGGRLTSTEDVVIIDERTIYGYLEGGIP